MQILLLSAAGPSTVSCNFGGLPIWGEPGWLRAVGKCGVSYYCAFKSHPRRIQCFIFSPFLLAASARNNQQLRKSLFNPTATPAANPMRQYPGSSLIEEGTFWLLSAITIHTILEAASPANPPAAERGGHKPPPFVATVHGTAEAQFRQSTTLQSKKRPSLCHPSLKLIFTNICPTMRASHR